MLKKLSLIVLVIPIFIGIVNAENYAVLITGAHPDSTDGENLSWNGGNADPGGFDEFWNDTFLMWEMLFCSGWDDEKIFVLFANGDDMEYVNPRYVASERYNIPPWNINHITDDSAYLQDVEDVFNHLDTTMTDDDFLFVWTFGHGSNGDPTGLVLMDGILRIEDFDILMPDNYNRRVFWMQQCFSGGFIEYLENDDTVILTAVTDEEIAYDADDVCPDGGDPLENDLYLGDEYTHGEFNYHVLNAARLNTIAEYNSLADSVDSNSDGLASMEEIWDWEDFKDSRDTSSTPQCSDPGSIAEEIFLDIPPSAPKNLELEEVDRRAHLTWNRNPEWDILQYYVYRDTIYNPGDPGEPVNWELIYETDGPDETEYTDPEFYPRPGGPDGAVYMVTAVDSSYQEGPRSDIIGSHGYIIEKSDEAITFIESPNNALLVESFPNPFNAQTVISFEMRDAGLVELVVYDVMGREVVKLVDGYVSAGAHKAVFDGGELASGVYFARLTASDFQQTQKILLIK